MKKNFFLRYWPISIVISTLLISHFLLVAFVIVQPIDPSLTDTHQDTPPASPVLEQTAVIPVTGQGGDPIFFDIFSSWLLWVFLGMVLLFFLFLLMARSGVAHDPGKK